MRGNWLDGRGNATQQPPATDRHVHRRHVRQISQYLQADRALSRDDGRIVIRRDEDGSRLCLDALGLSGTIRNVDKHDVCTLRLRRSLFDRGCLTRHYHGRLDSCEPGSPGQRLGMITRRVRDDASRAFLGSETAHCIESTSQLEGSTDLQALSLEPQRCCLAAQRRRQHGGMSDRATDTSSCNLDVGPTDESRRRFGYDPCCSESGRIHALTLVVMGSLFGYRLSGWKPGLCAGLGWSRPRGSRPLSDQR